MTTYAGDDVFVVVKSTDPEFGNRAIVQRGTVVRKNVITDCFGETTKFDIRVGKIILTDIEDSFVCQACDEYEMKNMVKKVLSKPESKEEVEDEAKLATEPPDGKIPQ